MASTYRFERFFVCYGFVSMTFKTAGPVSTSYAALQPGASAHAPASAQGGDTLAALLKQSTAPRGLIDEALKLEDLKSALWAAFQSAPETGIPGQLIDLASVYTNTLRLQLSLISNAPAKLRTTREPGRPQNHNRPELQESRP
jgi:hypothetical protein